MKNSNNIKHRGAYVFISIGIVLILISILFHIVHLIDTQNKFLLQLNEIFAQILSHLGIASLAIGIITILFDTSHWTHYFEKRLSNIVSEKEYLQQLDTQSLINLQTEVLKAYFKNDQIGGSDGFLNYYQKNIQAMIGMPFRTNINVNLQVSHVPNSEKLKIKETISYICMANSGRIQDNVGYIPELGEHDTESFYFVSLQHEDFKNNVGDSTGTIKFDVAKLMEIQACTDINKGFNLDIKQYNKNGLNVFIRTDHLINKHRFIGWRMSHPTRNLSATINFPLDLSLAKEFFFNENDSYTEYMDAENGTYSLNINDWLLPDEGITWQFIPKGT